MDAHCGTSLAKIQPGLHAGRDSPNLAMVGAVAAPVSECDRRHFSNFPGSSSISGISWRKCRDSCWYGWSSEHRQRFRKSLLGLGIRFAHTTSDVHRNVPGPGAFVLRPSRNNSAKALSVVAFLILMCYGGGFGTMPAFTADYFRIQKRWPHLRSYAHRMGFSRAHSAHCSSRTCGKQLAHIVERSTLSRRLWRFDALAFRCSSAKRIDGDRAGSAEPSRVPAD